MIDIANYNIINILYSLLLLLSFFLAFFIVLLILLVIVLVPIQLILRRNKLVFKSLPEIASFITAAIVLSVWQLFQTKRQLIFIMAIAVFLRVRVRQVNLRQLLPHFLHNFWILFCVFDYDFHNLL